MSDGKLTAISDELYEYILAHGVREDEVLHTVRESTDALGSIAVMQISPDQGALLELLTRMLGARRAIELGTFTGYSAICIARGLAEDGMLLACELDPDRAEVARANFELAGVGERIELQIGPALATLDALTAERAALFDLAFIDADKAGYLDYYERCLALLRPGGLIAVDNVLRGGAVLDPPATGGERSDGEEGTRVILELNELIAGDERVDVAMLGIADGVTLARKR